MSVRSQSTGVFTLALLMASTMPAALAEVRWTSGAVSTPEEMRPAQLAQTIAQLAARPVADRQFFAIL